jgi:anthranilate/para-aminobenzoate synthase component I
MPLCAIVVDTPPDPVALAQRFAGRPGFALLHGASDGERGGRSFLAFDPVATSTRWLPPDDVETSCGGAVRDDVLGTATPRADATSRGSSPSEAFDTRGGVPRWIGAIPYECARSLERAAWTLTPDERPAPHVVQPRWQRYGAVIDVDPACSVVRVVGDDAAKVAELAQEIRAVPPRRADHAPVRLAALADDDPPRAHVERIRRAQELIRAGDLYQVNLARRLRFAVASSPLDLYLAIASTAPAAFGACIDLDGTFVCASSPELFLAVDPASGRVVTAPIKGTRPRGADADADAALRWELDQSVKERAELTMILDVERNDLGKVCEPGSVRLLDPPRVQTHRTIHHRAALLGGMLKAGATPLDALRAMFPSGSVTGAPKVRAMEVIARLEPARRGLYTGAFGYVACNGAVNLAMAIRVMTIRNGEAHYFAGGGIVADSDPEAELDETRWKGTQIERLVQLRAGRVAAKRSAPAAARGTTVRSPR